MAPKLKRSSTVKGRKEAPPRSRVRPLWSVTSAFDGETTRGMSDAAAEQLRDIEYFADYCGPHRELLYPPSQIRHVAELADTAANKGYDEQLADSLNQTVSRLRAGNERRLTEIAEDLNSIIVRQSGLFCVYTETVADLPYAGITAPQSEVLDLKAVRIAPSAVVEDEFSVAAIVQVMRANGATHPYTIENIQSTDIAVVADRLYPELQ